MAYRKGPAPGTDGRRDHRGMILSQRDENNPDHQDGPVPSAC